MVRIRRIDHKGGDKTQTYTMQQAVEEANQALETGHLVVDETEKEKRMLQNALGIQKNSRLTIHQPIGGG